MRFTRFIRESLSSTQIVGLLRFIGLFSLVTFIWGLRTLVVAVQSISDPALKSVGFLVGIGVMFIPAIAIALDWRLLWTGRIESSEGGRGWYWPVISLPVCLLGLVLVAFAISVVQIFLFDYFELIPRYGGALVFVAMLIVLLLLAYGGPGIQRAFLRFVSRESTSVAGDAGKEAVSPMIDFRGLAYLLAITFTVYAGFCKSGELEVTGMWGEMSGISLEVLISFLAIDAYKTQFIDRRDVLVMRILRQVFVQPATYITIAVVCLTMWHLYSSYLINPLIYRQDAVTTLPWTAYHSPVSIQYSSDLEGRKTITIHDDVEARLIIRELKELSRGAPEITEDDEAPEPRIVVSVIGADGTLLLRVSGRELDQELVVQDLVRVTPSETLQSLITRRLGLSSK